jgi:hypothetical protein
VTPRDEPEQLSLFAEHSDSGPAVPLDPKKARQATTDDGQEKPVADEEPTPAPTKRSRSKRASVPTWDEIMFGPKD